MTPDRGSPAPERSREPTPYVAPLGAFGRSDVDRAGGKGANLGELVRAGFPVPAGFVITTDAYDLLLRSGGLGERLPALLARKPDGSAIRGALAAAEVPPAVADAARAAYRGIGRGGVAVRSSATTEDLPQAAFAGQQETSLNVVGEEELLHAVRGCWASLWTERAVAYRHRRGLEPTVSRIAVVVQRMVPAEFAGVMFTVNPVTGARDEVVVDAGAGLGEAVVSGRVTPDHFVVGKRRRRLREVRRGRREVVVRALPAGGTEEVAGDAVGGSLPRGALRRVVRLGVAIEHHFGSPQDIEWAWADGRAYILQARPITALPGSPLRVHGPRRAAVGIMAEILPIRPFPLDMTTWTGSMLGALIGFFRFAGVRLPPIDRIFVDEDGVVVRLDPPSPRPMPRMLLLPARLLRLAVRHNPRDWEADPLLTRVIERVRALERRDLRALEWGELHATLRAALSVPPDVFDLRVRYIPRAALAIAYVRLLLGVPGHKDRMAALFATDDIKTTEINRALESLAAEIRSDPDLLGIFTSQEPAELLAAIESRPFMNTLRDFLDRYGNRETVSPGLATQPTWSAAPQVVVAMLKGFASAPPPSQPRGRPAAQVVRAELLAHPLMRLPLLRSLTVRALDLVSWFVRMREDTRFYVTLPLPVIRRIMLEFGRRLADEGVLDSPEDVFHLKLDEVERARPASADLRKLVERRKKKRASLAEAPLVDPRLLVGGKAVGDALLTGTPASPGVAEGPARIIHDAYEFDRLRPGDVLVAPYTHPAWTPLFQRAAAVVVDSGGAASHAAIVAREYGIPAVMGTGEGTALLTDGQAIRVDGNRGIVLPLM